VRATGSRSARSSTHDPLARCECMQMGVEVASG
jgi:hypothetical protein